MVRYSAATPSGVLGGKNSKEKTDRPDLNFSAILKVPSPSLSHCGGRGTERSLIVHREVDRLSVVDDHGGGGLLWDQLVQLREIDVGIAASGQQVEHQLVMSQIGAGRIAPAVALALSGRQAQLALDEAMDVFGHGFGRR